MPTVSRQAGKMQLVPSPCVGLDPQHLDPSLSSQLPPSKSRSSALLGTTVPAFLDLKGFLGRSPSMPEWEGLTQTDQLVTLRPFAQL